VVDVPRAYQYLVWGTVGECSQYLVRRAEENKDALSRTKEGRKALGKELLRRVGLSAT
jgi:proline dehydrogenase